MGQFDRQSTDLLFGVFHCDLEHAVVGRGGGAAKSHGATGLDLQMQGCGLQRMCHAELDLVVRRAQGANARKQVA